MTKRKKMNILQYNSGDLKNHIKTLSSLNLEASYYLLILAGPFKKGKQRFLIELKEHVGEFQRIDLREIISANEDESFKKIDKLFTFIGETEKNILFENGDCLAGEYTGFTYSSVRYATPQEKYLLKKIIGSERFFVMDLTDPENIDKTMERISQTAVFFDEADSFFGKILWRLKQIKVNGHTFSNKRPAVTGF